MPLAKTNAQYNWSHFNVGSYVRQNYAKLLWEDRVLARMTIAALLELGVAFDSKMTAIDICNGGVLRGPSLIAPFVRSDGTIFWSDHGNPQMTHIQNTIQAGKRGDLGIWGEHQYHMGRCHPIWSDASFKACRLGKALRQSIFDLPARTYDIGITCFGPESLTEDRQEWEKATLAFLQAVKPDHPIVMLYMVNSNGYSSPGVPFPAIPIGLQDVLEITTGKLSKVQTFFIPAASQAARLEGETRHYDGMAGIVGLVT